MLILSLAVREKSGYELSLLSNKECLARIVRRVDKNESQRFLKDVDALFVRSGKKIESLNGLAVAHGKGRFTLNRMVVVTVNTFAYALNLPIYSQTLNVDEVFDSNSYIEKVREYFIKGGELKKNFIDPVYDRQPTIG